MRYLSMLDIPRTFMSASDLKVQLRDSYDWSKSEYLSSESLLIFDASRQRTWLIANSRYLYCLFDVIDEAKPRVQWRISKDHIIQDNRIIINISTDNYSVRNGYLILGEKRPRKYSRLLFQRVSVESSVRILLMKAFELQI
jgi:hypothetical protein